ncbi:HTH-type transcriptional regulator YjdC [Variibacter gotjawalensis]|uniref:HTH-type transcriptional regulator YjdC n=2 Tax=Variibacter gotjawalensis TaxID=1333996 RepID=A0A0S3PSP0_9BRAD|nr:TetR/AcrR family transcriptional regulator [Variibacter gotjawalensis]NIK49291.1 AcrR family transcriptional regulator [Variibacter gotjawalensis]RZS51142.1 TetR family transcriptional regulator [Variibacter gotjawalensis]BAT58977.1 HTH-type transcriptional regulator YjdC [Variibacter gotjawalensis]
MPTMRETQAEAKPRDTRDRILRAADELFYGHGINSVGVDAIAAAAGVTKRTLYHHFDSKDALVAAYVGAHTANFRIHADRSAREQILRAFEKLAQRLQDDGFRGCAFINAAAELSDRKHPAVAVATNAKDAREAWFRDLAKLGRASRPELLAKQLAILFDGTIAQFLVRRDATVAAAALAAAEALTADLT